MRRHRPRVRVVHYTRARYLGRTVSRGARWALIGLGVIISLIILAVLALWAIATLVTSLF